MSSSTKIKTLNSSTVFFGNDPKGYTKNVTQRIYDKKLLPLKNKVYGILCAKLRDANNNIDKPLQDLLTIDMNEILINLEKAEIESVLNKMCKKYKIQI